MMNKSDKKMTRRGLLKLGARVAGVACIAGGSVWLGRRSAEAGCETGNLCSGCEMSGKCVKPEAKEYRKSHTRWQIDTDKCIQCGKCATECVLPMSAVRCVHSYEMCGNCELCFGFFEQQPNALNTAAENQRCPTAAIKRKHIEDVYYEYKIREELCVGCGKCVAGCTQFGNASLYLQVMPHICTNCNECAIAAACPSEAIRRVPASKPYKTKTQWKVMEIK